MQYETGTHAAILVCMERKVIKVQKASLEQIRKLQALGYLVIISG